jgi:hypothetical protein
MKNYKLKSLVVICSMLFVQCSLISQEKYFDPQPENFMKQINTLFKENQHEELEELGKKLEKEFKAKKINDYQLTKMCDILNAMHDRKMNVYPQYKEFITAAIAATNSGYEEKFQDRWYLFVKGILENAKRGNNRDFKLFIDFSNDLFQYNALVADKSKSYVIETKDLNFAYENAKILVRVPTTNIKGYFRNDTATIYNTNGEYNVMEKLWKGNSGMVNWSRIGLPANEISATFGKYQIDMSKPSYSIDSVKLSYPEYFPTPVYGKLTDMITKEADFTTVDYPQFVTYGKNFSFDRKVAPNVKVSGGFMMKGNDVVISTTDGSPVNIYIYDVANTRKLISAEGTSCVFKRGNYIRMERARIKLFADKDSITHPYASIKYDVTKNEVIVLREDYGGGKARYRSTFHKMSFDTEMLTWKLDDNFMDLKMLVGKGKNGAKFVSDNNFDQETYNTARTASSEMDPLSVLSKMSGDGNDVIPLDRYVASYGPSFSSSAVLPSIFALEKDGFVGYNATDKTIKVNKEMVSFYQKANQKKTDYDILRFKGFGDNSVGRIYIKDKKLEAVKVYKIPFNDSAYVYAYPFNNSKVELSENRKLKFDGKVLAGRLDLYGNSFKFNYDTFSLKSDSIDKIKINIPEKKDEATGEEVLHSLKSTIEKVKGEVYINSRFNRSGKETARMYPKLASYDKSYVYYDNPNIFGGRYKRDDVYFELVPFKKDSMLHFEYTNMFFDGKFYSARIFEPFTEKLRIQKDLSLGFTTSTSATGFKNYQGKGDFTGTIKLSNSGIVGKGSLKYMTTTLTSDSILYFPDQTNLFAQAVEMKEQKGVVEFPQLSSDSSIAQWRPYSDTMLLMSTKRNPFDMFNNVTKMHGLLILENNGLSGTGFLDFDEAKISSNNMRFKSTTMAADTSSMEIKSMGNKVTFKTPNVKCLMNFESKIGDFKSNDKDISTDFAYNQYKAEINEFRWDMTRKILTFKAKEGTKGSKFTSTHPLQDSLQFYTKLAEYNMVSSIIKMDGVEEILVADSRVIPDNGKVTIYPEAKMELLKNATIEGDTANLFHVIEKATIDIKGKNDILGHGEYNLKVNNMDYPIKLHSIKVTPQESKAEKKSRKTLYNYTIEGTGKVEKSQNLKIYRNTDFHGNVHIFLNKKYPHFEGMQRIEFSNPSFKSLWFAVDNEINVSELSMYKKELKAENEKELYTGFMIDRERNTGLYSNLLAPLKGEGDNIMLDARGTIKHLPADNHYIFGDSARILAGAPKGVKLNYADTGGTIVAEGKMNPSLKIGGIPLILGGMMQNDLNANTYKYVGTAGLNISLDMRVLTALTNFISTEFSTNKDIYYPKKETRYGLSELLHEKDNLSFNSDIEKSGAVINGPKYTPFNIILSDLILDYDANDVAFRSKPEFGVSVFGGRPINKLTQGFVELGYGEIFDYFTIYMKSKSKEWVYINYSEFQVEILTSNEFVNNSINQIEPKKRIIKKSATDYYTYAVAGQYGVDAFVKRMSKGGKYSEEERKITPTEKPNVSEKEIKNAEIIDEKSPELKELEKLEGSLDSAESIELKALEAELRALEDQKDALKKAEAEKGVQLKDVETENPNAPDPIPAPPIEIPKVEEPKETPKKVPTTEPVPTEEEKPTGERESPTETPTEKKEAEPEKKEEGKSPFDAMF